MAFGGSQGEGWLQHSTVNNDPGVRHEGKDCERSGRWGRKVGKERCFCKEEENKSQKGTYQKQSPNAEPEARLFPLSSGFISGDQASCDVEDIPVIDQIP